jgi:hypothetical protein
MRSADPRPGLHHGVPCGQQDANRFGWSRTCDPRPFGGMRRKLGAGSADETVGDVIAMALQRFLRVLVVLTVGVAGLVVAGYLLLLGWGMLMHVRGISERTRRATKRLNPYLIRVAGTRLGMLYFNLSALHHVGRRSGRAYLTPLSAYPLGDGFVLAAAYPYVDWLENVRAAGNCMLTWNGDEYALERPELISRSNAMKAYPLHVRPFLAGAAGQNEFVWLHRAGTQESEAAQDVSVVAKEAAATD